MWIMWLIMITALLAIRAPHGRDTHVSFGINEIVTLLVRISPVAFVT